jgi:hypothetical protein
MDKEKHRGVHLLEIKAHIAHDNLVCTIIESDKYKSLTHKDKVEFLTETIVKLASMAKWESLRS